LADDPAPLQVARRHRLGRVGGFAWPTIPRPHGQPLAALPPIASLIAGELAEGQERHATLLAVRDQPYVLDDATVERSLKLHTEQRDFLGVFAEQLARWRNERPTSAQRRELDRLDGQLERLRAVLTDILELAEELQQGTIERVLAKSDLELGIEALLRMTNGR
jgi:signal transduction histidine kinase